MWSHLRFQIFKRLITSLDIRLLVKCSLLYAVFLVVCGTIVYKLDLELYSAHNLYCIEQGRYKTPLVPCDNCWCAFCYQNSGHKPVESELHVLLFCPLYTSLKTRLFCEAEDASICAHN